MPYSGGGGGAGAPFSGGPITSDLTLSADVNVVLGINGGSLSQQTGGVPDQTVLATGTLSNAIIICENADKAFNFAHGAQTNPTIFIHSPAASTTQWGSLYNNGSDFQVTPGPGIILVLNGPISTTGRFDCNETLAVEATGAFVGISSDSPFGFSNNPSPIVGTLDAFWERVAAAIIQQGADTATAVNQTYKGANSTGANVAGGNLTLAGGDATSGNAAGGDLILNGGLDIGTGLPGSVSIGGGLTNTNLKLDRTITGGGTTGAQTINKIAGTVNFAAAAATLVVTNNLVNTSSIIFATVRTGDATALIKNVIPAAGSFTITLNAAATAETSVGFWVTN